MNFFFFSKWIKGNNNVTESNDTHISKAEKGISDYCRRMINKLMDENRDIIEKNHQLIDEKTKVIKENIVLSKENKRLKGMLKDYLDS